MNKTKRLTDKVEELSHTCQERTAGLRSLPLPELHRSKSTTALDIHEQVKVVFEGRMPRRCHQCHTPLEEALHSGVKPGVGVCPLPHWTGCDGDVPEGDETRGQIWAPCPTVVTSSEDTKSDEKDTEFEITDDEKSKKLPVSVKAAAASMETAIVDGQNSLKDKDGAVADLSQSLASSSIVTSSSSGEDEILLKRKQLELLQVEANERKLKDAENKEKKKQRRLKREKELAELEEKTAKLIAESAKLKTTRSAKKSSKKTKVIASALPSKENSTGGKSKLQGQVAEHEARRQLRAAQKLTKNRKELSSGLTINGIREVPEVQQQALDLMSQLQNMIPSLSKDPSAHLDTGSSFQPAGVQTGQGRRETPAAAKYVYVASLGQTVPVVETPDDLPAAMSGFCTVSGSDSDEECSADDDCPFSPELGKRFAWRRKQDGSKFFKVVDAPATKLQWTYVLDKQTGRYEKCQVPVKSSRHEGKPSTQKQKTSSSSFKDHRVYSSAGCNASGSGLRQSLGKGNERQPSYVCPDAGDKQGKESRVPELIRYARDCPVSWTSKVTTDKLNPILWSWAYVAELLATRTGHAPALQDGELEARLQHFLSVLEIVLQTTTQSDFSAEAWKVARLYHVKVQQKIDSGVYSWIQNLQQWGSATLPHELMAARAEVPLPPPRIRTTVEGTGGTKSRTGEKAGKKTADEKPPCGYWNNSENRGGKCKWELEHDGETCNRPHICAWCKSKDLKPMTHQSRFCRKRIEDEGE